MMQYLIMGIVAMLLMYSLPTVADSARHHVIARVKSVKVAADTVDINTADKATLATLKGIGPKKAQAIVDYREKNGRFRSLHDLAAVKGIGEKSMQKIIKNNGDRLVVNP